jgi:DNA-binding PadR family transcriptional regulator
MRRTRWPEGREKVIIMHHVHWEFGRGGPFGRSPRLGRHELSDMFGPAPRADRGIVRYLVLDAIARQPRHGYEIIQAIEERSAGTYRPSPGVVYPTLQLLEELGHARVEESEARKVYAITPEGERDLGAHAEDVAEFYQDAGEGSWEDIADELRDVFGRVGKMFRSIGRSARRGRLTPSTLKKLRVALDDALAKIEAIVDPADR